VTNIPALVDPYGMIDEEKAKLFHDNELKALEHDPVAYNAYKRKNPRYIDDAFIIDASKCLFNHLILSRRQEQLRLMEEKNERMYVQGDLYWIDGVVDGNVGFKRNDHNGKFFMTKILDATGPDHEGDNKLANNVGLEIDTEGKRQWFPKNDRLFVIGCDPIRFKKTDDNRASKAGALGWEKFNIAIDQGKQKDDWTTHMAIMEYLERPDRPEDAAEDMIMAVRYLGCSINIENNVASFTQHFNTRGYGHFIINKSDIDEIFLIGKPSDEPMEANETMVQDYLAKISSLVVDHGHRIPFPRLVDQLLKYNRKEHTKFDLISTLGFTLYGILKKAEDEYDEVDFESIMDTVSYENGRMKHSTMSDHADNDEDYELQEIVEAWDF
jgi:hypothetical protein